MPKLVPGCTHASRVGPQSVHFFEVLGINCAFLDEPISNWPNLPPYQKFCMFVKNFPLTNDHTEHMIKRTSDYANFGPTKESEFQDLLQAVVRAITRVPCMRTKSALVTALEQTKILN